MGATPFYDTASSGGHLLVVQGDLIALAVDAVIIPCDADGNANAGFLPLLGSTEETTYGPGHVRVPEFADLSRQHDGLAQLADVDDRQVWILDTTRVTRRTASGLVAAVTGAVDHIRAELGPGETLALPLPGVGEGGFGSSYFSVIATLIPALEERAATLDLDIVLVLGERSDFAAVQHFRRDTERRSESWGRHHGDSARNAPDIVDRLAKLAREGQLVAFIGAGASMGTGAPSWWELLRDLAVQAGIPDSEIPALQELDARDAATVIARRAEGPGASSPSQGVDPLRDIHRAIVERLAGDTYTVTQGLLAGLALPEAITTNYDRQYEIANTHTNGTDRTSTFGVLPRVHPRAGTPWVMKIHGDVAHPDSIVISRDDYLRFDRDSAPAAGVLQSRMLTSHLLFIGYSMSDENIVRLARDVQRYREAFTSSEVQEPVGTVLELRPNPLRHQLWDGILDFVTFELSEGAAPAADGTDRLNQAARRLRVFLDLLARHACDDAPYLLDPKYRDLVTSGAETHGGAEELMDALTRLATVVEGVEDASGGKFTAVQVAAERARRMLTDLGLREVRPE